ncbi:hypothetical protein BD408DRAFT_241848 [Parasitella parasitica]|nr:hypothetical protein BD408DRAFT_241848 [Parasitella parasitica]
MYTRVTQKEETRRSSTVIISFYKRTHPQTKQGYRTPVWKTLLTVSLFKMLALWLHMAVLRSWTSFPTL